jgi:phospholipase/carboxylesterase
MFETVHFDWEFIPAQKKSPYLMIVLHGKGDSLRPFRNFDEELEIKNLNFLLLNAPKKYLKGYSWYGDPPYQTKGVKKIREKLLDVLKSLESLGWDSRKIFIFGFSQGCLVGADLALNYDKPFAGVIGVSGYFQFFPKWRGKLKDNIKTPWLLTHGKKDDVLPFGKTKKGARTLKQAGFKIDFVESNKKHIFDDEEYPLIKNWVSNVMAEFSHKL